MESERERKGERELTKKDEGEETRSALGGANDH